MLEVIELDSHRIETQLVDFIHMAPGVSARVRPHLISYAPSDDLFDNLSHWIRIEHLASNFLKNGTKIDKPFGGKGIYKIGTNPGSSQNQQKPNTSRRSCSDSYQCRVLDCQWPEYPLEWYRQCINMNEIRALYPGQVNEDADEQIIINAEWPSFNGFRFKSPAEPFSTNPKTEITPCPSVCDGWTKKEACRCTHMINLEFGKTYDLIFTAMQDKSHMLHHPIHLHGHTMDILYAGYGNYQNGKLNPQYSNATKYNPIFKCPTGKYCHKPEISNPEELQRLVKFADHGGRPSRRTTFHLPTQGFIVARLKADNPGIWLAHCHMMMHHEEGMAFLLNVTDKGVPKLPPGFPKCPNFNEPGELESSLVSFDSI